MSLGENKKYGKRKRGKMREEKEERGKMKGK
jgi:hypothetical protein